ncbi:phosphoesterase [Marinobacterium nitratireducens]|uniref:Phosphoesterase n=1 Tax=Marinobacterium nitratireducens TaxID=518897 RepID=A0A917ZP52_9GAMM|nr:bifunctional DedA family/phosphatase PAP2 family protein [Marinobacterium nitratireducens]GGO86584.1 phosphoesterase [Marinobacterium nitratireducens]
MDLAQLSLPALMLVTAALALCESLAFVGVLVPGVALLFAVALAAGEQGQPLLPILIAAFAGAVVGDGLSFLLGRHAEDWLQRHWPLNAHPGWHRRGAAFFQRYGLLSIVLGRFIGPVRPVVPFIAGTFDMPAMRFFTVNILSALAWAPAYIVPGFLVGRSADDLLGHWHALFYPGLGLVLVILAMTVLHQHLQPGQPLARWGSERLGLKPERLAALMLLAGSALALCALALIQMQGWAQDWNRHLQGLILLGPDAGALGFWLQVTAFGSTAILLPAAVLLGFGLKWLRRSADGWRLLLLLGLTAGLNSLLKWLFQVARPETGVEVAGWSFPSGHSSASSAFFAMLAVLLATGHGVAVRRASYLLALMPILLIGLSRIVIGAHWPLDVIAGWIEGLMAAAMLRLWLLRPERGRTPLNAKDATTILAALIVLAGALSAGYHALGPAG